MWAGRAGAALFWRIICLTLIFRPPDLILWQVPPAGPRTMGCPKPIQSLLGRTLSCTTSPSPSRGRATGAGGKGGAPYFAIPVSGNAQLLADARKAMWDARYLCRGRPVIGKISCLSSGKMPSWYETDGPANLGDPDAGPARMVEMRAYADGKHSPEIVDAQGNPITDLDAIFANRQAGRGRRPLHAQVAFFYEPYWGHGVQNVSRRLLKVQIFGA